MSGMPSKTEIQIAEAFGRHAARHGQGRDACPYEAAGTPEQRILTARWVHAWIGAGGDAGVSYGDGYDEPDEGPTPLPAPRRRSRPDHDAPADDHLYPPYPV